MIRLLTSEDLPAVCEMVKDSFAPSLWPYMTYTQHGLPRYLQVALDYPRSQDRRHLVVATDEQAEGVLGFADFTIGHDGIGFLSYVCVAPAARGKGLATAMFDSFLQANRDLKAVKLDTFRDNVTARALYSRWGFEVEASSAWVVRALPAAGEPALIDALAVSLAAHDAYGFCELNVRSAEGSRRVGLLGDEVVRCFTSESFEDDTLLGAVRGAFDRTRTGFAVLPEAVERKLVVPHDVLLLSDRMSLALGGGRSPR